MFKTPGGNPASPDNSAKRVAVAGVTSLGLATTVHPAARAAHFPRQQIQRKVPRRNAPRHAAGRRWVQCNTFGPLVKASLCSCRKAEAKNRKFSATEGFQPIVLEQSACRHLVIPAWPTHRSGHRSALQTLQNRHAFGRRGLGPCGKSGAGRLHRAINVGGGSRSRQANVLPVAGSVTGIQPPSEAGTKLPSIQWCRSIIRPPPGRRRQEWSCR